MVSVLLFACAPAIHLAALPLPIGPEIHVAPVGNGDRTLLGSQVATFPDGGFVVVWTVGQPGGAVLHARLFAADGTPAGHEFQLVRSFGSQGVDSVAALGDGSFAVAYEQRNAANRSIVLAARFDNDGKVIVRPFRVHAASGHSRYGGIVAADPTDPSGGGFAVAWTASEGKAYDPLTSVDNTYVRRFTADGVPLWPEIRVSNETPTDFPAAFASGLAVAADGSLSVAVSVFEDSVFPLMYLLDPSGTRRGVVGGTGIGIATNATVILTSAGTQVFAFSDGVSPGDASFLPFDSNVWAVLFAADGTVLHEQLQINRRGSFEVQPWLAPSPDGGFVAVWTDGRGRDGDGTGVFGRAFAADGTPLTRDFRVNITTAGDQVANGIAANASGDTVVVWSGPQGLFARRLSRP
ncbi:MAG TPA: hypothetical protein VHQ90_18175 [Thermoanaerobaculia bacterium]|nr:hypothetical protein [Thermoanaerobaculia bacterium]